MQMTQVRVMAEVRLIDANILKEAITQYYYISELKNPFWFRLITDYIDNAPTVEQPTGAWIYNQYDGNPKIGNWHCSNCRNIVYGWKFQKPYYNFCPNCGAKMKIGDNDNG